MDSSPSDRPSAAVARFTPDRRYTALAAAGVLLAAALALFGTPDPAGRFLFAAAAAVLVGYVVTDLVFSPRLTVTSAGIVIRAPFTRVTLAWPQVDGVRAGRRDRLGLRSTTLEIDAGPVLAVFSRRTLGADPDQAAALIQAFRPD